MAKVIEGTKDAKMQVLKSTGGVRKVRCSCGGLAVEAPDGKGGTVLNCGVCHKQFKSVPL